jgi:integrase/recombinase XerD
MTPIAPLITDFLRTHLPVERGCSPHTCDSYAHAFRLLFAFAADLRGKRPSELCIEDLDAKLILGFLTHLEEQRHNGPASRNARLAAIKAFMRYLEFRQPAALAQVRQILAIPSKRHDKPLLAHLGIDEIQAILKAPDPTTRLGIRDRAMLHLCFAAGLRVSELVSVLLCNLTLQPTATLRVQGKGRRERCLPLWKQTAADLRAWLAVRGDSQAPQLFLNAVGSPMSRAGFEYVLMKHVRTAGATCPSLANRSISPHQLRHSCALVMLQATRDIRKVALWLGHADIRTTEIYLQVDPTEKLEAVEAVVPPALRKGRFKAPDALIASLRGPRLCGARMPETPMPTAPQPPGLRITPGSA